MIYIYCEEKINRKRLSYVLNHLLKTSWDVDYIITSDESFFLSKEEVRINYSARKFENTLWIIPNDLMYQDSLEYHRPTDISEWRGVLSFFQNSEGDIPFDLFATTFYLLTCYEEYMLTDKDEHGRFPHKSSLLYKHNSLEVPVIDRWSDLLRQETLKRKETSIFKKRTYRMVSTYDIDAPYIYKYKGLVKTAGHLVNDFLHGHISEVKNRIKTCISKQEDPFFDALHYIIDKEKEFNRNYYLFILAGGNSEYDRSRTKEPKEFYAYLNSLDKSIIGVHPSYYSICKGGKLLKQEKTILEKSLNRKMTDSRFHFLRLKTPDSYLELIKHGITDDYSLCFSGASGFRSGTCIPYPFYNLLEDKEYPELMLHPTIMMDSTLIINQKLSPEEGLMKIKQLIDQSKQSGGDFVGLWHNSNLAGIPDKNPWKEVYSESLRYGYSLENN